MRSVRLKRVTATRPDAPIFKMLTPDNYRRTARAKALPHGSTVLIWRALNNSKAVKHLSSSIDKVVGGHNNIISISNGGTLC